MDGFPWASLWTAVLAPSVTTILVCMGVITLHPAFAIYAQADKRRHNKNQTPLLGGVGIILGIFAGGIALTISKVNFWGSLQAHYAALALLLCLVAGAADDIYEIKPIWKLLSQNIIAFLLIAATQFTSGPVDTLFGNHPAFCLFLKWFWAMGLLNSMNLIDGLDGLAAGVGIIALSFLAIIDYKFADGTNTILFAIPIAALSGFLFLNRHPAKLFMGESGAMAIACVVFIASMTSRTHSTPIINFVAPLFAIAIPIIDTSLAIFRRILRRTSILVGDREHIHHRLMRLGVSHGATVAILNGLSIYLCLIAYQFLMHENFSAGGLGLVLAGLALNGLLLMTAEQKLYAYLTSFATHMIKVLDQNNYGILASHVRIKLLESEGIPFLVYRINMEDSVRNLLEKTPRKIQAFYSELSAILRKTTQREIYFENSTSTLIIHIIRAGDRFGSLKDELIKELENFENQQQVDLYLRHPKTITLIPVHELLSDQNVKPIRKKA